MMGTATPTESGGGLPGPISENFGAFEPRFYGISFRLETPLRYRGWLAKSGVPVSPGPALPEFEETCLQTALEHEKRHFHDALVSPFANAILLLRLMAVFNGLKVFNRGMRSGANCLPVPVKTWMAMTEGERAVWLTAVSSDLPVEFERPLRPLPLPFGRGSLENLKPGMFNVTSDSLEEELRAFAHATVGAYVEASSLMRGPATLLRTAPAFRSYSERQKRAVEATFSPRNVFEASALAVQVQAAWTQIGEGAARAFTKYLLTSDLGYAKLFRRIGLSSAPADRPGMVDPSRVSAVAVWSLLGDPSVRDDFDPVVRLSRLLQLLDDTGGVATTEPVAALWDKWDACLKLKCWRTSIKEMCERTARSVERYVSVKTQAGESHAAAFATVLEAYLSDQRVATELLLRDPDSYVSPVRYIEVSQNALPEPLLSVELGEFIAPFETIPTHEALRLPRVVDKDGVQGWNRSVVDLHEPPRPRLLDAALELEFLSKICDVAFSDEALSPIDSEVFLRAVADASGMRPLFVF